MRLITDRLFLKHLGIFILLHCILYAFILQFNRLIPFSSDHYLQDAYHYVQDLRIINGPFQLIRALGQYDAQIYLKIAHDGYPSHPMNNDLNQKTVLNGLVYAFFPVYPMLLYIGNICFSNIEVSAFIISNILLVLNFASLYFILGKFYPTSTVLKSLYLLFLFPLSIFFRSYYTEGIILLELIWFSYFVMKQKWLSASFVCALLLITHLRGLFIICILAVLLLDAVRKQKTTLFRALLYLGISFSLFLGWIVFCYIKTGDGFYFYHMQNVWVGMPLYDVLPNNMYLLLNFFRLPFHDFHYSQLDIIIMLLFGILIVVSKRHLPKELWMISTALWLGAVLTHDTMSFGRVQTVSFPLFIYLAKRLDRFWFVVMSIISFALLGAVSLFFVNWYWVG